MESITVRDLMLNINEYPRISREDTLYDAVLAMERAREVLNLRMYKPRRIFVVDDENRVIGRISQVNLLRGLEPKYKKIAYDVLHAGLSISLVEDYALWQRALDDICRGAFQIKVEDVMEEPSEGEFVDENESLDRAMNQLVVGGYQSLIVTSGKEAVGVLRLSDVFDFMCIRIKACKQGAEAGSGSPVSAPG